MTETKPRTESRSTEVEMEIAAPLEAVWKALTDAEELANWFPLDARVTPGQGGTIWLSWGPGMEGEAPIEIWEPNRRFRWVEGGDTETPVVVDFTLETRGGKTVLRLVNSGFGPGPDWDDQYNATRVGWHFELRSLRHYLEHHRGRQRHAVWARQKTSVARAEAWRRLLSSDGLAREGSLDSLKEGSRYSVTTATGDRLEGVVQSFFPEWQFGATVENRNHSLLRVELEPGSAGNLTAYVWLSAWDLPQEDVDAFRDRWQKLLGTLLPVER